MLCDEDVMIIEDRIEYIKESSHYDVKDEIIQTFNPSEYAAFCNDHLIFTYILMREINNFDEFNKGTSQFLKDANVRAITITSLKVMTRLGVTSLIGKIEFEFDEFNDALFILEYL